MGRRLTSRRHAGFQRVWRGEGYGHFKVEAIPYRTSHRGRIVIFEMLTVGDEMKAAIMRRASVGEIATLAERGGMVRLRDDGLVKAASGITTIEEVLKHVV